MKQHRDTQKLRLALNSTPLIYFAKIDKLDLILNLFRPIIDMQVYDEVVRKGFKKKARDALIVESAIKNGKIRVVVLKNRLNTENLKIGPGELSTITLVKKGYADIALIDDSHARKVAKLLNVEVHGSLFLLKYAVLKKVITKDEAIKILNNMIEKGFRISPRLITYFYENI